MPYNLCSTLWMKYPALLIHLECGAKRLATSHTMSRSGPGMDATHSKNQRTCMANGRIGQRSPHPSGSATPAAELRLQKCCDRLGTIAIAIAIAIAIL